MLALGVRVGDVAIREVKRRVERDPVVRPERERRRHRSEDVPSHPAPVTPYAIDGEGYHDQARRVLEEHGRRSAEASRYECARPTAKPGECECGDRKRPGRVVLEQCRGQWSRDGGDTETGGRRGAGARREPLAEPADDEHRNEKQHTRRQHTQQPEGEISLEHPVGRRLGDPGRTLELERRDCEERDPRRLVRIRMPVEERAVEQVRLERERVIQDDVPRQLVPRTVLRARETDRRKRREGDQGEHQRLEPVAREPPHRRSLFVSMSNHMAKSVNCEPEISNSAIRTTVPTLTW